MKIIDRINEYLEEAEQYKLTSKEIDHLSGMVTSSGSYDKIVAKICAGTKLSAKELDTLEDLAGEGTNEQGSIIVKVMAMADEGHGWKKVMKGGDMTNLKTVNAGKVAPSFKVGDKVIAAVSDLPAYTGNKRGVILKTKNGKYDVKLDDGKVVARDGWSLTRM